MPTLPTKIYYTLFLVFFLFVSFSVGYIFYKKTESPIATENFIDPVRSDTEDFIKDLPPGLLNEPQEFIKESFTLDYGPRFQKRETVVVESRKTPGENYEYYTNTLLKEHWLIVDSSQGSASSALRAQKDNILLIISITSMGLTLPSRSTVTLDLLRR